MRARSSLLALLFVPFALACGDATDDSLGTNEGEKRVDPRADFGRIELAFPNGVDTTGWRAVFENDKASSPLALDRATTVSPRKGCVRLLPPQGSAVNSMRKCEVVVDPKKTTTVSFGGLDATKPSPDQATFGRRPRMLVELVRDEIGKPPFVLAETVFDASPVVDGTYRARWRRLSVLDDLVAKTTVAGGAAKSLALPDASPKLANLRIKAPSSIQLPDAPRCGARVDLAYESAADDDEAIDASSGVDVRAYPLGANEGSIFLRQGAARYSVTNLAAGQAVDIELGRIDVSDVALDDGATTRTVKGTYSITRQSRTPVRVGCNDAPTGTGLTLIPGSYEVRIAYRADGRDRTLVEHVTVP